MYSLHLSVSAEDTIQGLAHAKGSALPLSYTPQFSVFVYSGFSQDVKFIVKSK
jgi:hypothetical protein